MRRHEEGPHGPVLAGSAVVFMVVLLASLFGIVTRPLGFLAAFWPANAILLGLLVRNPGYAAPAGWAAAVAGYYAADLLTGNDPVLTTWLTLANLSGVVTGFLLYRTLGPEDRRLGRPLSVLYLFCILLAAAGAAALVGAWISPTYFGRNLVTGAAFWFCTELANGIIVLPVMLAAPRALALRPARVLRHARLPDLGNVAPFVALLGSVLLGVAVGGPGALAFPAPALLWCALRYSVFGTVLTTMLVSVWHLIGLSIGIFGTGEGALNDSTMSGRLGVMLFALGPLTVATVNSARNDLLRRLEHLATYDVLTGALTRRVFFQRGEKMTAQTKPQRPLAVLMLDIDHFKLINDTFGHAAGDQVLATFSDVVRRTLRAQDLFGRIGGEEFAVILPDTSAEAARQVAERLREAIAQQAIPLHDGTPLRVTVSIGYVHHADREVRMLQHLLAVADSALYAAKTTGRNRVTTGLLEVTS